MVSTLAQAWFLKNRNIIPAGIAMNKLLLIM
jgi:hypothetical protein